MAIDVRSVYGEIINALVIVGAMTKYLPALAAVLAIVWYAISIWESDTGHRWRVAWRRVGQRTVGRHSEVDHLQVVIYAFLILCVAGFIGMVVAIEESMQWLSP